MSRPTLAVWIKLKRLARYLLGKPRAVHKHNCIETHEALVVHRDSDWAGCPRTRTSTSGGVASLSGHAIKTWGSTQGPIALSSGEAEFYGDVKAAEAGLGIQAVLEDMGSK